MKIRQRPTKKARIEIIPMIDVIFFLLVFFMVSSLAMTKLNSLPVSLPKTSESAQAIKQDFVLTVRKNGQILVNQATVNLDQVATQLGYEMRNHPQETVVINADEGTSYGLVVQVMDRARSIGVRKFALATEAASSK